MEANVMDETEFDIELDMQTEVRDSGLVQQSKSGITIACWPNSLSGICFE